MAGCFSQQVANCQMARGATTPVDLATMVFAGMWTGEWKSDKVWSWNHHLRNYILTRTIVLFAVFSALCSEGSRTKQASGSLPAPATAVRPGCWHNTQASTQASRNACGLLRQRCVLICFLNLELSPTCQERGYLGKGWNKTTSVTGLICPLFPLKNQVFLRS